MDVLSVNNVMINLMGYPLSYIEFAGTVLYFLSAFLVARKNIWTWPVGIVSVLLYFALFYQIRLYSDMLEQVYYFVVSIIGWITWQRTRKQEGASQITSRWSRIKELALWLAVTAAGTLVLVLVSGNLHRWMPVIFPKPADYLILDALTTVMSLVAMYLMTIKRNENWIYWIIVDVIAIWLYWVKGVHFISIQYAVLLVNAIYGAVHWHKSNKTLVGNATI